MTPQVFHEGLQDLMQRAFASPPVPLSQIIIDLTMAKAKCVAIRMNLDAEMEAREMATKIVPANGMMAANLARG
jgi:hypothetical protein